MTSINQNQAAPASARDAAIAKRQAQICEFHISQIFQEQGDIQALGAKLSIAPAVIDLYSHVRDMSKFRASVVHVLCVDKFVFDAAKLVAINGKSNSPGYNASIGKPSFRWDLHELRPQFNEIARSFTMRMGQPSFASAVRKSCIDDSKNTIMDEERRIVLDLNSQDVNCPADRVTADNVHANTLLHMYLSIHSSTLEGFDASIALLNLIHQANLSRAATLPTNVGTAPHPGPSATSLRRPWSSDVWDAIAIVPQAKKARTVIAAAADRNITEATAMPAAPADPAPAPKKQAEPPTSPPTTAPMTFALAPRPQNTGLMRITFAGWPIEGTSAQVGWLSQPVAPSQEHNLLETMGVGGTWYRAQRSDFHQLVRIKLPDSN